jgi:hypothetical protein
MDEKGYQRLFLSSQGKAHFLDDRKSPSSMASARCGAGPKWFGGGWYGTGSQIERTCLRYMDDCQRCRKLITKDRT